MSKSRYVVEIEYSGVDARTELDGLMSAAMDYLNESLPLDQELHVKAWRAEKLRVVSQIDYVPETEEYE